MGMIIDADAHFTPVLDPTGHSSQTTSWLEDYLVRKQGQFSDANNRITELAQLGVDRQLLNPMGMSLGLSYKLDPVLAVDIMRVYNDTMLDIAEQHSEFDVNIWLALQDVNACLEEIKRCQSRGFFGVYVSDLPLWGFMSNLEPLWAYLEEHRIPWYMHLTREEDRKLPIDSEWNDTAEILKKSCPAWMASLSSMVIGEVFDRYPDLRVVVVERDINWSTKFDMVLQNFGNSDAFAIIDNNLWFTIEPERTGFLEDANIIGHSRLLFATDWPHDFDEGGRNSRYDVATMQALDMDQIYKDRIFYQNYQKLRARTP